MRYFASFVAAVLLSTCSREVLAQDLAPENSVRFTYTVNAACPTKDRFSKLVSERGVSITENETATRSLDVTMDSDPLESGKWSGRFRLSDATSSGSTRTIEGASCDEVARSLAIFAALALAPVASEASSPLETKSSLAPIAPVPPPLPQPELSLHRHRFALGASTRFFKSTAEYENAAGVGISASYFLSDAFGLRLDATYLDTVNAITPLGVAEAPPPGVTIPVVIPLLNEARAKVMAGPELDMMRAHGTLTGRHGNPFDIFLRAEVGAIWTRYQLDSTMSFEANAACELDVGARLFVAPSVAITLEAGWFLYDDHYRLPSAIAATPDLPESTAKLRTGPIAELGFEIFLPQPK